MLTSRLALIAVPILATACGGGGGSISIDNLDEEYQERFCEAAVDCGGYPDVDTCMAVSGFAGNSETDYFAAAEEAGRLDYDGGKAEECIDFLTGTGCELTFFQNFEEDYEATCGQVFTGTVAVGGSCIVDEECAGDAECVAPDDCTMECCVGTCTMPPPPPEPIPVGGDCSSLEADCVDGSFCKFDKASGMATCTPYLASGQPCDFFDTCAPPTFCQTNDMGMGTCAPIPSEGQACTDFCNRTDLYCDAMTMVCTEKVGPGSACTVDAFETGCVDWAWCNTGMCAALPRAGESCANTPGCMGNLLCNEGTMVCEVDTTSETVCPVPM